MKNSGGDPSLARRPPGDERRSSASSRRAGRRRGRRGRPSRRSCRRWRTWGRRRAGGEASERARCCQHLAVSTSRCRVSAPITIVVAVLADVDRSFEPPMSTSVEGRPGAASSAGAACGRRPAAWPRRRAAARSAMASSTDPARTYSNGAGITSPAPSARGQHRLHDVVVAGAAAEVAFEADSRTSRSVGLRVLLEQRDRRHHHARRAVPALQAVVLVERLLHRVQLAVGGQALDRGDRGAVGLHGEHRARLHRLAVEVDGAGAARRRVAADVRAGEAAASRGGSARAAFGVRRRRCAPSVHRDRYLRQGTLASVCARRRG